MAAGLPHNSPSGLMPSVPPISPQLVSANASGGNVAANQNFINASIQQQIKDLQ